MTIFCIQTETNWVHLSAACDSIHSFSNGLKSYFLHKLMATIRECKIHCMEDLAWERFRVKPQVMALTVQNCIERIEFDWWAKFIAENNVLLTLLLCYYARQSDWSVPMHCVNLCWINVKTKSNHLQQCKRERINRKGPERVYFCLIENISFHRYCHKTGKRMNINHNKSVPVSAINFQLSIYNNLRYPIKNGK